MFSYSNTGNGSAESSRDLVDGDLSAGVTAKDVILHIIRVLGVNGGVDCL